MAKNKSKSQIPSINLKGEDFIHTVPADKNLEVIIHWKGQGFQPEFINPVHAFCVQQGKFKVINRNLMDTAYVFDIKEIKAVYIIPMGEA